MRRGDIMAAEAAWRKKRWRLNGGARGRGRQYVNADVDVNLDDKCGRGSSRRTFHNKACSV